MANITISLWIQVIILAVILYGYIRFRVGDLRGHGFILSLATLLHIGSVAILMIPKFFTEYGEIVSTLNETLSVTHIVHAALGIATLAPAALISLRWFMNRLNPKGCRGKMLMRATFVLWIASLVTGILINLLA